ncbi:Transposase [Lutispora thermophila DSM 19022]|uniref:Transposase n=2 Tax=Lutispora TaxID=667112 RepID=A0A1M6HJ77_9FIRM|nr:Transposase [Lutispora thermophila DSM 19022]
MLSMTQIKNIRKMYFEEGKNISQIARETGHDRKTIREYIYKDNWNKGLPKVTKGLAFTKLEPFKADIDAWLNEDKKARRKQRHTAKRVYDRLVEKYKNDFNCSYRTVAAYVAIKKKEIFSERKGFLPLEHIPGEAQVDFGDADFYENGKLYNGKYLNLSFPYSNKGYTQLFKGENQECLFEGLKTIFEHIGGVPTRIWFDNTSTIVTKVIKGGGRTLTDDFLRFMEHYGFEAVFCNVDAGHEKGNVENKVGYHRRNMLVPVPRFERLSEFNKELLVRCEEDAKREHYRKEKNIEELFRDDVAALLELSKTGFDTSKYITVKTNGYGKFFLNNGLHEYSVSPKYANEHVLVKLTAFHVIILDENYREILRHKRLYGNHKQQSMQWLPYLNQLARRPGALKYTGIYQMLPQPLKEYMESVSKQEKGKVLKAIADLTQKSGFEKAVETVSTALSYGTTDLDSLINLHSWLHEKVLQVEPVQLPEYIPKLKRYEPNLFTYDKSLRKAGAERC